MPSLILLLLIGLCALAQETSAPHLSLLTSRNESRTARLELIRRETEVLRLSTFEFGNDAHGRETLGMIVDARKRGVKVKLLFDGLRNGIVADNAILKSLVAMGVEVKLYHPPDRRLLSMNNRTHMKSLIGSQEIIIGDRNMKEAYFARRTKTSYISVDALLRDPESQKKSAEHFDDFFNSEHALPVKGKVKAKDLAMAKANLEEWSREALRNLKRPRSFRGYDVPGIRYVADHPNPAVHSNVGIKNDVLDLIRRSNKTLTIMNPYVFLTPELKRELEGALERGVKIKIMSNSAATTDQKVTALAWEASREDLARMGIDVYELKPGQFIHAKTIVRDGVETYIGSYNLDPRSQNLNVENGIFFTNEKISSYLETFGMRVRMKMMLKVDPVDLRALSPRQRVGHCIKSTLRKLIIAPIHFAL